MKMKREEEEAMLQPPPAEAGCTRLLHITTQYLSFDFLLPLLPPHSPFISAHVHALLGTKKRLQ